MIQAEFLEAFSWIEDCRISFSILLQFLNKSDYFDVHSMILVIFWSLTATKHDIFGRKQECDQLGCYQVKLQKLACKLHMIDGFAEISHHFDLLKQAICVICICHKNANAFWKLK